MENIIQFLIDESRRYLHAKNSHNLTLKKYRIPPSPQPAAKREAWARRRNTAYAMASTGSCAARGFEWTTQMAAAAGSPVYLYSTPRVQQLRCIPVLQGVCGWRQQCAAAARSPFYLYNTSWILRKLCHLPLQLGGCGWTRGDGGRQGEPPLLPRLQSQLRVEQ